MNPLTKIPAKARLYVYIGFFSVGVLLGAIEVGYASVPLPEGHPTWLIVALKVYGYLGAVLGLTAASNVTSTDTPPPAPEHNPLNPHDH